MKSPFKFLDSYTLADKAFFFGRDKESKILYQYVHATSLVLLYGLSGTGKSSLVQCGLSQRFDGPDWYPFFIRRGANINESTREVLTKALQKPTATDDDLPTLVGSVFRYYFRPVYLIFDQFEELFTLKKSSEGVATNDPQREQEQFFESLNALLTRTEVPCKILLIMREEFIGQLYEYERIVPSLFDYRLRVEPMNASTIQQVVNKTFTNFNITTEPTVTLTITSNLLKGQATSQLAYLQVYMDRLWREAQAAQVEHQHLLPGKGSVHIDEAALILTGDVSNVLNRYLDEQENDIQNRLDLADDNIMNVLDSFVTAEGTKQPVSYQLVNGQLLVSKIEVTGLTETLLNRCLLEMEKARLIRRDDSFLELAHDSLAGIIDQKRTAEQRLLNNLIQSFRVNYELYTRQGGFLNEQQVALYDQFQQKLLLETPVIGYIEQSRTEQQREADQLRTTNSRLQRQRKQLTGFVGAVSVLLIASTFLYKNAKEAETAAKEAEKTAKVAETKARANLEIANRERANLLLVDAETYLKSEDYQMADENIKKINSLLRTGKDRSLDSKIKDLNNRIHLQPRP